MKAAVKSLFIFFILSVYFPASAQRLDPFTSTSFTESAIHGKESIPYERTVGFYDYIDSTQVADILVDDKHYYFIYFKLPIDVTEIGIRVISPVPDNVHGNKGDFETNYFISNQPDKNSYFDTHIALEQRTVVASSKSPRYGWHLLGENDNSDELQSQPSGKSRNSLLRVTRPKLEAGVYRIRISDAQKLQPVGSYLLQLGLVPGLKGIKISRDFNEVAEEN